MSRIEFTNMCMIYDQHTSKVLVQDRVLSWVGVAFPGGHVEEGESLVESVIREIKEETGLTISDVKLCGITHFFNDETKDQYFIFNYKTEVFSGELIEETREGKNFWVTIDDLHQLKLANGFKERLVIFLEQKYSEGYTIWNQHKKGQTKWY